jgi:hypothetical protein
MAADLAALYKSVTVPPALCTLDAMKAQWAKVMEARKAPNADAILDPAAAKIPTWMNLIGSYGQELTKINIAAPNPLIVAHINNVKRFTLQEVLVAIAANSLTGSGGTVMSNWEPVWFERTTFARPNECDLKGG